MGCKRLIVTHHSPFKTDDELRRFERLAREVYPSTDFARSGQHWDFPCVEEDSPAEKHTEKKWKLKWFENIQERLDAILPDSKRLSSFVGFGTYILRGGHGPGDESEELARRNTDVFPDVMPL